MIYYFSGTGNSLDVSKLLAERTNDAARDVIDFMRDGKCVVSVSENENLGIVYPVYFGGTPCPVKEFIENTEFNVAEGAYVYCVLLYGGSAGGAVSMIKESFDKKGIKLNAAFTLLTPDNYLPVFNPNPEESAKILDSAHEKAIEIADAINKKTFNNCTSPFFGKLQTSVMYRFYANGRKTKKFFATENCISCGLCEKICPVNAIALKDGKPQWIKNECAQCLGCLNRCPKAAIEYGKSTKNKNRYVNPILN